MKEKKILIVSHNSFSKVSNNGKTLESIFSAFQKENLAQIFFSENENPDFDFCENFFKITDKDVLWNLLHLNKIRGGGVRPGYTHISGANLNDKKNGRLYAFAKSNIESLIILRDILWLFNSWKTKVLAKWVEEFNPDIIFYLGGNFGFSHRIAREISKKNKIPLVTYFTDDYLINPINKSFLDFIQKVRMKHFYKSTVKHSSLCFAIGDSMAKEYTHYFEKEFISIMNSVNKEEYVEYEEKDAVVFSYFGGLHLNRWKMLIKIAKNLTNATLKVYTISIPSREITELFYKANIQLMGGVEGDALKKAMLDSDVLLHVESDDVYYRSLTKLSVSTKIPEYLMAGRFVFGFGPEEVASMKLLSENNVGFVVSSDVSDSELKLILTGIIGNFENRKEVGKKGYEYAVEKFDVIRVAESFKNVISNISFKS